MMNTGCSHNTLVHILLGMTFLLNTYSIFFLLPNPMFLFSFFLERKFGYFYNYFFGCICLPFPLFSPIFSSSLFVQGNYGHLLLGNMTVFMCFYNS